MKAGEQGYSVAVVGASSLLGKELISVLRDRKFPVSRLVTFEAEEDEPDLPIVDLREGPPAAIEEAKVKETELDLAFLAARPERLPSFLHPSHSQTEGSLSGDAPGCFVIDAGQTLAEVSGLSLSIPSLEDGTSGSPLIAGGRQARFVASAHPAAIVVSSLLLRLAARFELKTAVVQIFSPASYIGPRAIEELQKQTVNLLSFQKAPRSVFGAQLAFNFLPRLGKSAKHPLSDLETVVRSELRRYLGGRAPLPAVRVLQAPVFYSLALSIYVELAEPVAPDNIAQALTGGRIRVRRISEQAPSQVEVTGSEDIVLDAVLPDAGRPAGIWLWATADDLHLAAVNAVEIAEVAAKAKMLRHGDAATQRVH